MKARLHLIIIILGFMVGCSSEESEPSQPQNNENPTLNNTPKTDAPKDLYIVNLGIGQKNDPAHITKYKSVTLRGNNNYSDIVDGKRIFHLFGANYNTDNSVPLDEDNQPETHSKYSKRNNLTASFVFTDIDDSKANMIFRISEPLNLKPKGKNTPLDVTKSITGGKIILMPIEGKSDSFPLPYTVTLTDTPLDTKNYGNLNIGNKTDAIPDGSMTFSQISKILTTPGDYPVIGFEFSIDDDNKGGADNKIPKLGYYPDFNY